MTKRIINQGTVFQTAPFFLSLTPRLRPGLLSLRSVLASSQIYIQYLTTKQLNNQTTKQPNDYTIRFVWKTIPSKARVTRDEVSGYMMQGGMAVWKTVPKHTKASK